MADTLDSTKHSEISGRPTVFTTDIQKNNAKTQAINNILEKAKTLRGFTLTQLTHYLEMSNPESMVHAKGLTGQIIEILLGATAKSKPLPDFPELGLEIKTLPIDRLGNPLETTYVCTAPLIPKITLSTDKNRLESESFNFKKSVVYKKLQHVLWLPIIVLNNDSSDRVIGNAFLWQPTTEEYRALEADWLELTEMLYTGDLEKVSSHYGEVLQIRPKAKDASAITSGLGQMGEKTSTLPRGFYLRTSLTKSVYSCIKNTSEILP